MDRMNAASSVWQGTRDGVTVVVVVMDCAEITCDGIILFDDPGIPLLVRKRLETRFRRSQCPAHPADAYYPERDVVCAGVKAHFSLIVHAARLTQCKPRARRELLKYRSNIQGIISLVSDVLDCRAP